MTITSPTTRSSRRSASSPKAERDDGRFVAEGEDLLDGRRRRGLGAGRAVRRRGLGPRRHRGRARAARQGLVARLAAPARSAIYEQRWAERADRAAVRRAVGRRRPGQRRHDPAQRAGVRRGERRARPRLRRPVRAQGGPRVDGRDLPRPGRALASASTTCRGRAIALAARAGRAAARPARRRARSSSAPSGPGCPTRSWQDATAWPTCPIAEASESLNAAMAATVALYEVTRPCP